MLSENKKLMEQYSYKSLLELVEYEKVRENISIQIVDSKSGQKTIQVNDKGSIQMIHSKYDPKLEAEKFISQFRGIENEYEHVMFYGLGLGYHIKTFMAAHPRFTFSIYEPEIEIFYQFLKHFQLRELPLDRLTDVLIETSKEKGKQFINEKIHNMQGRILVITLPSYERVFKERYLTFSEELKKAVKTKRQDHYVNMNFSARWTLNSLINLPTTLQTPNILNGFNSFFKDKPLIIVSAGPSLEDEYENLRYIKENKLAYIFAVGSANRALITKNILPDAVCTYDPQEHNFGVFRTMLEKGIDTIPMVFGSSVGFETVQLYKGPKLHMITDQDTISPYYLKYSKVDSLKLINDSPTIAAVTFQLAAQLGSNPIIFVGQNLGFRNDQYYSKDVNYFNKTRLTNVMEKDRKGLIYTDDVYGNFIQTNASFNLMKENIEWYISQYNDKEVLNTTKGGAAIKGSQFIPLEVIIKNRLKTPVVYNNWFKVNEIKYKKEVLKNSKQSMERSLTLFNQLYYELKDIIYNIKHGIDLNRSDKVSKNIQKFNKVMIKFSKTDFHTIFARPINREFYQALSIKAANIRRHTENVEKAKLIINAFAPYLDKCKNTFDQLEGTIYCIHDLIDDNDNLYERYLNDCGAFKYEGKWKRFNRGPSENVSFKNNYYVANENNSSIKFRFNGTKLRIFGTLKMNGTEKISVTIDGKTELIKLQQTNSVSNSLNYKQLIFSKENLSDCDHEVELKLLFRRNEFIFYGIEIDKGCRTFHVDEVLTIEDLKPGKRIRVHYKANYSKYGEFSNFGQKTDSFIPINSTPVPSGDFYFIMVNYDKCIADRNLQAHISWNELKENGLVNSKGLKLSNERNKILSIQLMTGGKTKDESDNDWDEYIAGSELIKNIEWNLNKNQLVLCLENNSQDNKAVVRGFYDRKKLKIGDSVNSWGEIDILTLGSVCFRPLLNINILDN